MTSKGPFQPKAFYDFMIMLPLLICTATTRILHPNLVLQIKNYTDKFERSEQRGSCRNSSWKERMKELVIDKELVITSHCQILF